MKEDMTTNNKETYPDVPCVHGVSVNDDCISCADLAKKLPRIALLNQLQKEVEGIAFGVDQQNRRWVELPDLLALLEKYKS